MIHAVRIYFFSAVVRKILVKSLMYQVSSKTSKGFWPHFCGILIIRPVRIYFFSAVVRNVIHLSLVCVFTRLLNLEFVPKGVAVQLDWQKLIWAWKTDSDLTVGHFREHNGFQIISEVVFSFLARCVFTKYCFNCNTGYFKSERHIVLLILPECDDWLFNLNVNLIVYQLICVIAEQ